MTKLLANFVQETCSNPGTGAPVALLGSPADRVPFLTAFASGQNVFYFMDDGTQAEAGIGSLSNTPVNALSRDTVIWNSVVGDVSPTRLNFTGTTNVYNALPAEKAVYLDGSGNLTLAAALTVVGTLGVGGNANINGSAFVGATFGVTGTSTFSGQAICNGGVKSSGYVTRAGISGGWQSNSFNVYWDGSASQAHLWIDSTDLGVIAFTSDRRIKQNIVPLGDASARVMSLRPVSYQHTDFGVFRASDTVHEGFVADEVQAVIPSGATGTPGGDNLQSLNPVAILAVTVKAVQEYMGEIAALRERLAAIETQLGVA